jgi:hypothetical protein
MKNNFLTFIALITFTYSLQAQNTTFNNVSIGTDVPAGGINMKMNFPGLTGAWARGFYISNHNDTEKYIGFGAYGSSVNGVPTLTNAYIGKDWNVRYMTFLDDGKIGIGTSLPNEKLVIEGNSARLKIQTSSSPSTYYTYIESNYNSANSFNIVDGGVMKFGSKFFGVITGDTYMSGYNGLAFLTKTSTAENSNIRMYINQTGNVGIGTTIPTANLEIVAPLLDGSVSEGSETLLKARISDATQDYFKIVNSTFSPGQFIPSLYGYHVSDNRTALYLNAAIESTNDNGTDPLMIFDSRLTGASIVNRPLFSWDSYGARKMTLNANGSLGIGTSSTGTHKLAVEGSIGAREIRVQATGWSDFVFDKKYSLPTLTEVEKHIKEKGHLKDIPSEAEVLKNGISLGEMDSKLLQKIEELTLYIIEMKKENEEMKKNISELKQQITTKK